LVVAFVATAGLGTAGLHVYNGQHAYRHTDKCLWCIGRAQETAARPISRAHAHNDYAHPRPLHDALDQEFSSVEVDIFLVGGELLVGHTVLELTPERTLQKLYLDPLRQRIREKGNQVHSASTDFYLLIDIKSDAEATYAALDQVLAKYDDILTVVDEQKLIRRPVTAVLSGNRAVETVAGQRRRFVGIDGRPSDLASQAPAHQIPWISERWGAMFRWNGKGEMPTDERRKLEDHVSRVHASGRQVRFWATPEEPALWRELQTARVDWINTDRLSELRKFFIASM
jgi:hypothetical protein